MSRPPLLTEKPGRSAALHVSKCTRRSSTVMALGGCVVRLDGSPPACSPVSLVRSPSCPPVCPAYIAGSMYIRMYIRVTSVRPTASTAAKAAAGSRWISNILHSSCSKNRAAGPGESEPGGAATADAPASAAAATESLPGESAGPGSIEHARLRSTALQDGTGKAARAKSRRSKRRLESAASPSASSPRAPPVCNGSRSNVCRKLSKASTLLLAADARKS